jgi:hypothetical protein
MSYTREEIIHTYRVDANGVIRNLGKFEAEMLYVPYFWDSGMNGFADEDISNVWFFRVDADDRRKFPEIGDIYGLSLWESEQGFVYCSEYETEAEYDKFVQGYLDAELSGDYE